MTVFINDDILQDKISVFFDFAKEISDNFIISREYNGKLPKDIFNGVNSELKSEINKEDIARREKYKKDEKYARELKQVMGIATKKQAVKYFDDVKKEDMKAVTTSRTLGDDKPFKSISDDFIETYYSKQSAVRRGPVFEIARFKTEGDTLKTIVDMLKTAKDVYKFPYEMEGLQFSDIAFYKGEEMKIGFSCKDRFCFMQLSKDELNSFIKLKVTDELN